MRAAALLAVLTLSACDGAPGQTLPNGVSAADVALFKTASAEAGCTVTSSNVGIVRTRTGFDKATLNSILQYLTLAGESEPTTAGYRLTSGSCANA